MGTEIPPDLESLLREAKEDRAIARLVPGVAHDVNTFLGISVTAVSHALDTAVSLRAALGRGALAKSQLASGLESLEEASRISFTNLERAVLLVRSLRHVVGAGGTELPDGIDLRSLIDEVATGLGASLKATPLRLVVEAPEILPLRTRPGALVRVLLNLVQNAVVHAFPDGSAGTVTVAASATPAGAVVVVRDDGVGMPSEVAARAFEPGFTTRRESGGTGLGLSIVRDSVEQALGGTVALETAPGTGTVFRLFLPDLVS